MEKYQVLTLTSFMVIIYNLKHPIPSYGQDIAKSPKFLTIFIAVFAVDISFPTFKHLIGLEKFATR